VWCATRQLEASALEELIATRIRLEPSTATTLIAVVCLACARCWIERLEVAQVFMGPHTIQGAAFVASVRVAIGHNNWQLGEGEIPEGLSTLLQEWQQIGGMHFLERLIGRATFAVPWRWLLLWPMKAKECCRLELGAWLRLQLQLVDQIA
jgi:hypothetical protein